MLELALKLINIRSKIQAVGKILLLLLVLGCSSLDRKNAEKLRSFVQQRNWPAALELTHDKKFYKKERSRLLLWLERGFAHHLNRNHYQAIQYLSKAKELHEKLFTKSLSKKALTYIANESADIYYGEPHEISMMYFFLAYNYYMLYQKGIIEEHRPAQLMIDTKKLPINSQKLNEEEKRQKLFSARAIIIAWKNYLDCRQIETKGRPVYKEDLLANVFGAMIHEEIGSSGDRQIARSLYKQAQTLLFRYYNTYASFNNKYTDFIDKFDQLHKWKKNKIEDELVRPTSFANLLDKFLQVRLKSKSNDKQVAFIINHRLIAPKEPQKFDFPIPVGEIAFFSKIQDGMSPIEFVAFLTSGAKDAKPSISFELPRIPRMPVKYNDAKLSIYKLPEKKLVHETPPLILLNPLGEIASMALENKMTALKIKKGTRLVTKHLAALAGIFATYKLAQKSDGLAAQLALPAAIASYMSVSRAIAESEKADLRYWSTIPNSIALSVGQLPPGKYQVNVLSKTTGNSSEADYEEKLGEITIKANKLKTQFVNLWW